METIVKVEPCDEYISFNTSPTEIKEEIHENLQSHWQSETDTDKAEDCLAHGLQEVTHADAPSSSGSTICSNFGEEVKVVKTPEECYSDQAYCELCGKKFDQTRQLIKHMKRHIGVKSHSCLQCGKSFLDRSKLECHVKIHTGEKPYIYSECGKSFAEKGKLNSHMWIHTGKKPHVCSKCGKSFAHKISICGFTLGKNLIFVLFDINHSHGKEP